MTLDEATRILLSGVTGANASEVQRNTGVCRMSVDKYLRNGDGPDDVRDRIYLYVWRQVNRHLLLSEADINRPIQTVTHVMVHAGPEHAG